MMRWGVKLEVLCRYFMMVLLSGRVVCTIDSKKLNEVFVTLVTLIKSECLLILTQMYKMTLEHLLENKHP
jgi:hypothetical protein